MLSDIDRQVLDRQDAWYLTMPLQAGPQPHSMAAHLRHVVRLLQDTTLPSPSLAAVTHLTGLYQRTVKPHVGLACRQGCAHCCKQAVFVTAAEAFAIAANLADKPAMLTQLTAEPERSLSEAPAQWRPCVMLDETQGCSIYAARPLACHGYISLDLAACLTFFVEGGPNAIQQPVDRRNLLFVFRMILIAAQRLTGHGRDVGYEMTSALAVILREPDAEARWQKGENILKGVPQAPAIPPHFEQEIASMVGFVEPTV